MASNGAHSQSTRQALAWSVHLFTASGAVLAVFALWEIGRGGFARAAIYMLAALAIDSVDGTLARRAGVAERLPRIDGRTLDDVVDYLNYAIVPVVFLLALGSFVHWSVAALPVIASATDSPRSTRRPRTTSSWAGPPTGTSSRSTCGCSTSRPPPPRPGSRCSAALIFVPLKYIYPSKLRRLRGVTAVGGTLWVIAMALIARVPPTAARERAAELSLVFPAYYVALSAWLGEWWRLWTRRVSPPRGALLINLGTPDAAAAARGAPLSARVPLRPARDRPAPAVARAAGRGLDPADAPAPHRRGLRESVERGGIAAARARPGAARGARRAARRGLGRRARDALRPARRSATRCAGSRSAACARSSRCRCFRSSRRPRPAPRSRRCSRSPPPRGCGGSSRWDRSTTIRASSRAWRDVAAPALAAFRPDHVLFSYHGLPERQIRAADRSGAHCLASADCCLRPSAAHRHCYRAQCFATTAALVAALGLDAARTSTSFQSRLGRTPWIRPYTDFVLPELAAAGVRRLAILCPSFVADCLETVEEIGIRARDQWRGLGGEELLRVDCPNAHPTWVEAVAQLVLHANGTAASVRDAAASPEASESETETPAT